MASLNDIETKVQTIIGMLNNSKTITGTLPLMFTAKAGNAVDWVIYGNAEGVGERTAQLVDKLMFTDGKGIAPDGSVIDNNKRTSTVDRIDVSDVASVYFSLTSIKNVAAIIATYDSNDTLLNRQSGVVSDTVLDVSNAVGLRITLYEMIDTGIAIADITQISLTIGSTAPDHYIPYGYEIPLTINNTPQTFYIGDSLLTEGETISKTSTGVDIELFEGENTVSTTLSNKPTMEIKYKWR